MQSFEVSFVQWMVAHHVEVFVASHLPRPSLGKAEAIIIVANPKLLRLLCHFVLPMWMSPEEAAGGGEDVLTRV